jgi:hypothetical protein
VINGSLSKGLEIKLAAERIIEGLAVGRYVVVHGQTERRFFGMITDVLLETCNPEVEQVSPPDPDSFLARVYRGTLTYGRVHITPMLVVDKSGGIRPAKTVPTHFTQAYDATPEEVAEIFGDEHEKGHFYVGDPLEMEGTHVALDLRRFVERSSGVFGKSGTGKTFLTRMLFGRHRQRGGGSEPRLRHAQRYGWRSEDEARQDVKACGSSLARRSVFLHSTLNPHGGVAANRSHCADQLRSRLEPEDLEMLARSSALPMSDHALYIAPPPVGGAWVRRLLAEEPDEGVLSLTEGNRLHEGTLGAIQRKLSQSIGRFLVSMLLRIRSSSSWIIWRAASTWCWSSAATATRWKRIF